MNINSKLVKQYLYLLIRQLMGADFIDSKQINFFINLINMEVPYSIYLTSQAYIITQI